MCGYRYLNNRWFLTYNSFNFGSARCSKIYVSNRFVSVSIKSMI